MRDRNLNRSKFIRDLIEDAILNEGGAGLKLEKLRGILLDLEDQMRDVKTQIRELEKVKAEEDESRSKKMEELKQQFESAKETPDWS
jgi:hypothetical protein